MGVVVREMTIDTRMAVERVMANSRKSRPMMPPISSRGMKTAMSEMEIEKTVKPISCAPRSAAWNRRHAIFQVARDVFHDDDGVVDDKTAGNGKRHQGQVVQREAGEVHDRAGADEGDRHGDRWDEGGTHVAQKQKDDQDDQDDRDDQRFFDVLDRGANGQGAVDDGDEVFALAGTVAFSEGRIAFTASTVEMMLAPG